MNEWVIGFLAVVGAVTVARLLLDMVLVMYERWLWYRWWRGR